MLSLLFAATLSSAIQATATPSPAPSPGEVVAKAPPSAWQDIPPRELLVMQLGQGRRVVIQLAPDSAPVHVANIRALARDHWWDRTGIDRVQDNYVVQWGGASVDRPLPDTVQRQVPAEFSFDGRALPFHALAGRDAYASRVGYIRGWPASIENGRAALVHCYAMVGAGRDNAPDTGTGAELYVVIGHAPRHLDRNMAMVGRVIEGMSLLSSLPRGSGGMGMYADRAQRPPIVSIRLASELPDSERPAYQVMDTGSAVFAAYLAARAHRRDAFFIHSADAVDICNAPVPVRPTPGAP